MPRRLLNIASIVCLVLCVALIGMWVRSYYWFDLARWRLADGQSIIISLIPGQISLGHLSVTPPGTPVIGIDNLPWWHNSISLDRGQIIFAPLQGPLAPLGFYWRLSWGHFSLTLPYWFLVLATGSLAIAFRMHWLWRFSLRSLFIAMTALAILMGMIVWLDQA
jgi:hypothetical protein